jgi:hypothetical protein
VDEVMPEQSPASDGGDVRVPSEQSPAPGPPYRRIVIGVCAAAFVLVAVVVSVVVRSWISAKHGENADFTCATHSVPGTKRYTVVEAGGRYKCTYYGADDRILSTMTVAG